jgi:hypothetical protein
MRGRRERLAVALVVASAVLLATAVAAGIAGPRDPDIPILGLASFAVTIAIFAGVGGAIAVRRPGNPIGWLLAAIGLLFAIVMASSAVARWGLRTESLPQSVGEWLDVPASLWVLALGLIGTQLPLRLPDGKLPSPRWRWYSRVSLLLIAVSAVGMAVQPGRVEGVAGTANPVGSELLKPLATVFLLVILCFIGGVAALVVRYRRSDSHDRAQLRWIAFSGAVFLGVYMVTVPLPSLLGLGEHSAEANAINSIGQLAFAALPIGIGYAVLKHRLYDIDAVISRTLSYATLTATLAGTYLGLVLLLQLVLSPSSDLAIAGSTLAVAALFRPARRRIQELVDRRFYRRRYDAARTLERFSARLRDEVDLEALGGELRSVVAETMQPAHASLWVRPR